MTSSTIALGTSFILAKLGGGTPCRASRLVSTLTQTRREIIRSLPTVVLCSLRPHPQFSHALLAAASTWETFSFSFMTGTTDQYLIMAQSNSKYLVMSVQGAIMPTAVTASAASAFRLVSPATTSMPTGYYVIQDVASSRYVNSNSSRPTFTRTRRTRRWQWCTTLASPVTRPASRAS